MRRGFARAVRALGLLCLLAATARANPPTAVITGPTGGVAGDILLLDASGSGAEDRDRDPTGSDAAAEAVEAEPVSVGGES